MKEDGARRARILRGPFLDVSKHGSKARSTRETAIQCGKERGKPIPPELLRNEIERASGADMQKQAREAPVEQPRQNDWDLKELMERLGGDQEFLRELLVMFREDVRMNLEKSRAAIAKGDYEGLSRTAHTMKGMLRNLSMGTAAETAAALEKASQESLRTESKELLEGLAKELEGILPEVEAQLADVKP